jgi:hypothetical protein
MSSTSDVASLEMRSQSVPCNPQLQAQDQRHPEPVHRKPRWSSVTTDNNRANALRLGCRTSADTKTGFSRIETRAPREVWSPTIKRVSTKESFQQASASAARKCRLSDRTRLLMRCVARKRATFIVLWERLLEHQVPNGYARATGASRRRKLIFRRNIFSFQGMAKLRPPFHLFPVRFAHTDSRRSRCEFPVVRSRTKGGKDKESAGRLARWKRLNPRSKEFVNTPATKLAGPPPTAKSQ